MDPELIVIDTESADIRKAIRAPLVHFNAQHAAHGEQRPILIPLRLATGAVVGGLCAYTADEWLYTELLFVPASMRKHGVGTRLMACAESEAQRRGCHSAWLGTFEFQARGFYEHLGYRCFAELPDHPAGHSLYFMKKALR